MVVNENTGVPIIHILNRYRKYIKNNLLPALYCAKDDGTHLPLASRVDSEDNVYLYCLTCDWEKKAGLVTADTLKSWMRWRDLHPNERLLDTRITP
jgi:hypothetical protein